MTARASLPSTNMTFFVTDVATDGGALMPDTALCASLGDALPGEGDAKGSPELCQLPSRLTPSSAVMSAMNCRFRRHTSRLDIVACIGTTATTAHMKSQRATKYHVNTVANAPGEQWRPVRREVM